MTELLARAFAAAQALEPSEQDAIAQVVLGLAMADGDSGLDPEHLKQILEGLAEADRGDFATDEELEAALQSFRV